jgi:hypothetical protein
MPTSDNSILPYVIIIETVESAFICACCRSIAGMNAVAILIPGIAVLYAARKTTRSAAYQGRISIRTISELRKATNPSAFLDETSLGSNRVTRKWWDYIPTASRCEIPSLSMAPECDMLSHHLDAVLSVGSKLQADYPPVESIAPSNMVEHSIQTPVTPLGSRLPHDSARGGVDLAQTCRRSRPLSTASSVRSRLGKYLNRMQLFRELLKNEVWFIILTMNLY